MPEAIKIIRQLRETHGELMFHQSGGCCDGSQPMCFEKNEFKVGSNDVYLGDIDGCAFFMSGDQFEYWKHTHLTIDITPGRGSSFSLEIPLGLRFIVVAEEACLTSGCKDHQKIYATEDLSAGRPTKR